MNTGKSSELAKTTAILLIGKLFTQFLSFFLLPLYTYMLPVAEYGEVDLILTYISLLVPVVTIQQEMATFRHLVDARNDRMLKGEIIRTSFRSTLIRLLIFVVPYVIVMLIIRWRYAYLVLFCGIFTAISNLLLQIARGFGDNAKYTIGSVIAGAVTILSNLLLICVFHFGAESILISMTIANICCSLFLFFSLGVLQYMQMAKPSKKLRNKMLKYSWPLVPNGISWWLINASDRTIVSIFLGVAENGIYSVAVKIPSIVSSFMGVFVLSWTESASVHINDDDRDEFFSSVAGNTIKIFSSLGILVIAAMPFVFDIIIGHEYRAAYEYIPLAIVGALMNCLVSVYSAIYVAKKMTKQVATTSLISAIINIVVDLVLIHFVGLYAAVISTAVAFFAMAVYRHFDLKKYVKIKYRLSDLVMATLGIIGISAIYYSGNMMFYIIGAVLAVGYTVGMNWRMISKVGNKVKNIFTHSAK